jgi:hypothetical protein
MAKTYVLDRVAADLARGHTHPAIQRLSSLVAADPSDLDLRRRLAAVYRLVGNRVQAGRWDYLTIGSNADDTRAFERAFPSAMARLRQIRWPQRAGEAATAYARERLAALMAAAHAERPIARTRAALRSQAARLGRGARATRGGADRRARFEPTYQQAFAAIWHRWVVRRPWSALTAAAVAGPLAVVGAVTVVEWIIH